MTLMIQIAVLTAIATPFFVVVPVLAYLFDKHSYKPERD